MVFQRFFSGSPDRVVCSPDSDRYRRGALLLGVGRRIYRRPNALKLAPIRSIAYFASVVEELLDQPPPQTYIAYLRYKLGFTPV